jgi:hypothetical protein
LNGAQERVSHRISIREERLIQIQLWLGRPPLPQPSHHLRPNPLWRSCRWPRRPGTVGHASGSEAVASKRGARLKGPHGKRSNVLAHPDPNPTVSGFNLSPREYLIGTRPTWVQTQPSGKSPARRTEERRPARRAQ